MGEIVSRALRAYTEHREERTKSAAQKIARDQERAVELLRGMGIDEDMEMLREGVVRGDGLYFRVDPDDPEKLQLLSVSQGAGFDVDGTFGSLWELGAIFADEV